MAPKRSTASNGHASAASVLDFEAADLADSQAEHIYIEDELAAQSVEPRTVARQFRIRNRVRGVVTELTLYREGLLRVRIGRRNKVLKDYLVEMRFLDPDPILRRHLSTRCLWTALGCGLASLGAGTLLPLTGIAGAAWPASILLATAAVIALLMCVYRSEERHIFRTAIGKARVVSLRASFGCMRRFRAAVRDIQSTVRQSARAAEHDRRYLRAEMQAHYRLAETGVITRKACSEGTALILSRFG